MDHKLSGKLSEEKKFLTSQQRLPRADTKRRIHKNKIIEMENICLEKDLVQRMKRQAAD